MRHKAFCIRRSVKSAVAALGESRRWCCGATDCLLKGINCRKTLRRRRSLRPGLESKSARERYEGPPAGSPSARNRHHVRVLTYLSGQTNGYRRQSCSMSSCGGHNAIPRPLSESPFPSATSNASVSDSRGPRMRGRGNSLDLRPAELRRSGTVHGRMAEAAEREKRSRTSLTRTPIRSKVARGAGRSRDAMAPRRK